MIPGGKWSLLKVINGCLIGNVLISISRKQKYVLGMVSICAGCNGYYPWATAIISCFAAVVYVFLSK